jgi:hypothetical protein
MTDPPPIDQPPTETQTETQTASDPGEGWT